MDFPDGALDVVARVILRRGKPELNPREVRMPRH
jgi:hypothetical protein